MIADIRKFAKEWIDSWNSHSIEHILAHYSDDLEITTPMIKIATGEDVDTLKGKENIKKYWETALRKIPDLRFELVDVTKGTNSIAVYYKSVYGKMSVEVMFFDKKDKVEKVIAHYTET